MFTSKWRPPVRVSSMSPMPRQPVATSRPVPGGRIAPTPQALALCDESAPRVGVESAAGPPCLRPFPGLMTTCSTDSMPRQGVIHGTQAGSSPEWNEVRGRPSCVSIALRRDQGERLVLEGELHVLHVEQALILLHQRVSSARAGSGSAHPRPDPPGVARTGTRPDEFRYQTEFQKILRLHFGKISP